MAKPAKLVHCQFCKVAVIRSGVTMLEHILLSHGPELLKDPGRLVRMAQDPATQRAIASELGRKIFENAARALAGNPLAVLERKLQGGK